MVKALNIINGAVTYSFKAGLAGPVWPDHCSQGNKQISISQKAR